jgi:hypothetical protein
LESTLKQPCRRWRAIPSPSSQDRVPTEENGSSCVSLPIDVREAAGADGAALGQRAQNFFPLPSTFFVSGERARVRGKRLREPWKLSLRFPKRGLSRVIFSRWLDRPNQFRSHQDCRQCFEASLGRRLFRTTMSSRIHLPASLTSPSWPSVSQLNMSRKIEIKDDCCIEFFHLPNQQTQPSRRAVSCRGLCCPANQEIFAPM